MYLSPHDGTDLSLCPFKAGQHVVIIAKTQVHPNSNTGKNAEVILDDARGLRPHRMSHGWYVWVRLLGGTGWRHDAEFLYLASQLRAIADEDPMTNEQQISRLAHLIADSRNMTPGSPVRTDAFMEPSDRDWMLARHIFADGFRHVPTAKGS